VGSGQSITRCHMLHLEEVLIHPKRFGKRDVELAEKTEARIHFSHVSLAQSVEIIWPMQKKRGVRVRQRPRHITSF